jgi:tetratricopeptide (TPR) repeat protein
VELAPDRDDYYYRCGEACLSLHEHRAALPFAQRAIELNPREPRYYAQRGSCFYHLEEYERALADLNCAVQLQVTGITALFYRAQTWEKLGDKRRAFDDYSTALARDPQFSLAYQRRGNLYLEAGRFAEAAADMSAAIALKPDDLPLYRERSKAYRGMGQAGLAEQDLAFRDQAVRRQVEETARRGVRVVTKIVQAFDEMYSDRYDSDAYAATILTFDPALAQDQDALYQLSLRISRLKETWPDQPELRTLARILTRERGERYRRVRIPPELTGGRPAYLADVWLYRPFLPLGRLDHSGFLYCVAEPGETRHRRRMTDETRIPPRLRLWHLFLWTAASGLMLAAQRGLGLGDQTGHHLGWAEQTLLVASAMIEGAALAGLAAGIFERLRRRTFPVEPGEWLLVGCGIGVAVDLAAKIVVRLVVPGAGPMEAAVFAFIPSAVASIGVYGRAFYRSTGELEWGPLFSTAAFSLSCVLVAALLPMSLLPLLVAVVILSVVGAGYALLIYPNAILQDVLRRRPRGWFHWTGVVLLPLHAGAYLAGLLFWLPPT